MKKVLCLLAIIGLLAAVGCGPKAPEDAAKQFIDQQILKHKGMQLDTSKLNYKVIEKDSNSAVVAVSGQITMKAEVPLVKKAGMWIVGHQEAAPKMAAKTSHEPAQQAEAKAEKAEKVEKAPAHEEHQEHE